MGFADIFKDFDGKYLKIWTMDKDYFYKHLNELNSLDIHFPRINFEVLESLPNINDIYEGRNNVIRGNKGLIIKKISKYTYPNVWQCEEAKLYDCYFISCERTNYYDTDIIELPICVKK